ncbi:uncharacterized protein CDAR_487271 [Caerostris darwini]|uniref:Uncharacterized protein n=1 Tax=Caerostris darwini TaxID=1538125 RepID=A0AAV4Q985_9ARAC|nr:uncharacterized protein CDAR_487271 [Caerostris darwini]
MKRAENEHYHHKPKDLSRLPAYAQKYPSLERSHLCDVKRSTLNPAIPTFRMKDMDDVLHKLTDTHCRHTTLCSADCFEKYSYVSHDPTHKVIRRDYCIEKLMKKYSFDVNKLRNPDFDILKTCPPERKYMEAAMSNQKCKYFQ